MKKWISAVVSSTVRDLQLHRQKVLDACLRHQVYPRMMEHLPASDEGAIAASMRLVEEADIYLGIIGFCYGYVPAGSQLSITHMEYKRAVECKIPRLIFLMHENHSRQFSDGETSESLQRICEFRGELEKEHVVDFFSSPDELWGQIIHSLTQLHPPTRHSKHTTQLAPTSLSTDNRMGLLESLYQDPSVDSIFVNRPDQIIISRRGRLEHSELKFRDAEHLTDTINELLMSIGLKTDSDSHVVEGYLSDGSAILAILLPTAPDGPVLTIHKPRFSQLSIEDLLSYRFFPPEMAMYLEASIKTRHNMLICGGTGSGLKTVVDVLLGFINSNERIVTIETEASIQFDHDHVVRLIASQTPRKQGLLGLIRTARQLRPDRIIVLDTEGPEILKMLELICMGHAGSIVAVHANTPQQALTRLENMMFLAERKLTRNMARQQLAYTFDVIVQVNRLTGGPRKMTSIGEVLFPESTDDDIPLNTLFQYQQLGVDQNIRAYGQFEATGQISVSIPRMKNAGISLPSNFFDKRIIACDSDTVPSATDVNTDGTSS